MQKSVVMDIFLNFSGQITGKMSKWACENTAVLMMFLSPMDKKIENPYIKWYKYLEEIKDSRAYGDESQFPSGSGGDQNWAKWMNSHSLGGRRHFSEQVQISQCNFIKW